MVTWVIWVYTVDRTAYFQARQYWEARPTSHTRFESHIFHVLFKSNGPWTQYHTAVKPMINPRTSYSIHPMFTTIWRCPKSWQPQKSSQNVWISWGLRPLPRKRPIHRRCRCLRFPGPNLQMETENLLKRGQNNHKPPMTGNGNHTTYLFIVMTGGWFMALFTHIIEKKELSETSKTGFRLKIDNFVETTQQFLVLSPLQRLLSAEWKEFLGRVTPRPGAGGGDSLWFY